MRPLLRTLLALLLAPAAVAPAALAQTELIADGSFEAGVPNPSWVETATSAPPLCSAADCADPAPSPRSGNWYAFFGGEGILNDASITQTVTVPVGASLELSFWLQMGRGGDSNGTLLVTIDGAQMALVTEAQTDAFDDGYVRVEALVPGALFGDGQEHELKFAVREQAATAPGGFLTFLVDDVSLVATVLPPPPPPTEPPLNDFVWTAEPIDASTTTYTGSTVLATRQISEASATCVTSGNDGDNSAWWTFAATADGTVDVDLAGSDFDTILEVYEYQAVGLPVSVACNDDRSGTDRTSVVSAPVEAGARYLVRVSGYNGAEGSVAIAVGGAGIVTGPPDDDLSATITLPLNAGYVHPGTNVGASGEAGEPFPTCTTSGQTGANSVWRSYGDNLSPAGVLTIDLAGSTFDTVLAVYGPDGAMVACNDDASPGVIQSSVTLSVEAGQVYAVQVVGWEASPGLPVDEGRLLYDVSLAPPTAAEGGLEASTWLLAPAPNPAAGAVRVEARLAEAGDVRLEAFDALGRSVGVVFEGPAAAGDAAWTWAPGGLPAGVYVLRLTAGLEAHTRRVTLVR